MEAESFRTLAGIMRDAIYSNSQREEAGQFYFALSSSPTKLRLQIVAHATFVLT